MRLVFIGLSLSSSWGNGHATTYRALLKGLALRGHDVLFLERDQPWYANNRDMPDPKFCRLRIYDSLADLWSFAPDVAAADAVIIGSYVPEAADVIAWASSARRGALCFYDIDTPVTLRQLASGEAEYLLPSLIPLFDFYFSFTGGPTLQLLERRYGARRAVPLYCSVDSRSYRPMRVPRRWDLGYLGTYSPDRQPALERLLLEPARRAPDRRFIVAGPQYPADIDWPANVERIEHLPPAEHPAFYAACAWTLNITRRDMVAAGHSPSVRLFEATACGTPVLSDAWTGIEDVLEPGREILIVRDSDDVLAALAMDEAARAAIGSAGRRRTLRQHTGLQRAAELEAWLNTIVRRHKVDWQASADADRPELLGVDLAN
ncbi:MAG: glycosyltransferase [Rhodospirillales bacterium 20-64-7]|nr:MAG: glycosyltransferase [Rhodospirillales bacterium 20-64-7]HQT76472.1 glycosyltransferase [Rhodopila sp.]